MKKSGVGQVATATPALEPRELALLASQRSEENEIEILGSITTFWKYPSNNPKAKSIVFVHGYRGNHRGLEAIAGALADFNIYIPDLPGFGKSQPLNLEHSIQNYSDWLSDFLVALNLEERPILLGHSFGSIICSDYAAQHDAIEFLILENPVSAPALKGQNAPLTRIAQGFFAIADGLPLSVGEKLLKSWPMVRGMSILMTKTRNLELRQWVHKQHDENFNDFASRQVVIEGYRASISNDVSDYAEQFRVPTLLIIGDRDDITSPKKQYEMAKKIRCVHSISHHMGVGHLTHYEIPKAVAEDIRTFVNQNSIGK